MSDQDLPPEGPQAVGSADDGGSKAIRYVAIAMALILVALIALLATSDTSGGKRVSDFTLLGQRVPEIAGPTLTGENYDIDRSLGEWVVVNFFAPWCVPCVEEHPELIAFDEANSASGRASVVSIAFGSDPAEVATFFEQRGGEWDVLPRDTSGAAISFATARVPETFLVTPAGDVAAKFVGGVTKADLELAMDEIEARSLGESPEEPES